MVTGRITPAVRRLLADGIDSFEKLELVLALSRAKGPVTLADLATNTELDLALVRQLADELEHRGLLVIDRADAGDLDGAGKIARLTPKPEDAEAVSELAALYDEDRLLVLKALSKVAMERIRGMAARTFADAFQLRGKKDDEDG